MVKPSMYYILMFLFIKCDLIMLKGSHFRKKLYLPWRDDQKNPPLIFKII